MFQVLFRGCPDLRYGRTTHDLRCGRTTYDLRCDRTTYRVRRAEETVSTGVVDPETRRRGLTLLFGFLGIPDGSVSSLLEVRPEPTGVKGALGNVLGYGETYTVVGETGPSSSYRTDVCVRPRVRTTLRGTPRRPG